MADQEKTADLARRTFAPVGLGGLAVAALLAVASAKPLAASSGPGGIAEASTTTHLPLAGGLGMIALVTWGVQLVVRGGLRRVMAGLSGLAAAGVLVVVLGGGSDGSGSTAFDRSAPHTGWYWTAAVAALLVVVAGALATRWTQRWPTMGSRYDAPGAAAAADEVDPSDTRAVWRALDEGRDPTDPPSAG